MLVLASASATRQQLLENAGLSFQIVPADVDERALAANGQTARSGGTGTALLLAEAKAKSVSTTRPGDLVIGADQTLIHNGIELHKPIDMNSARNQLQSLRGSTHQLHSAVTLVRDGALLWSHVETANLTMRTFTDDELHAVLTDESTDLLGSVGSYRLEGPSIRLFDKIEGDYFAILGLPLLALLKTLRQHGFPT